MFSPAVELPGAAFPYLAPYNFICLLIVIFVFIEYSPGSNLIISPFEAPFDNCLYISASRNSESMLIWGGDTIMIEI